MYYSKYRYGVCVFLRSRCGVAHEFALKCCLTGSELVEMSSLRGVVHVSEWIDTFDKMEALLCEMGE